MATTMRFNPAFQTDQQSITGFVVRSHELAQVLAPFSDGKYNGPPRVLVTAPRGAGKTTLCRRVLAETRREGVLRDRWHAIFLSEESYVVTTPGEFLLECLYQLADQVPEPAFQRAHEFAADASSEEELVARSLGALREAAKNFKKRILVIVENFHTILHDQIAKNHDILINILSDDKLFGILATSVAQSDIESTKTLPADYLRVALGPLMIGDCQRLWLSLTGRDAKKEKIRPLEILTGGSPRLLHVLADFMRTPSLQDLMDNLNVLIDQNTEYFKSQLDGLPPAERKVFAALLEAWDPKTAKEVAESARVTTNNASAMLGRLNERGSVTKDNTGGRASIYYASERLFNIYYLMRRRSHPSNRVRALVTFMTQYYDRDELVNTMGTLTKEACTLDPESRGDYHSTFDEVIYLASPGVREKILAVTPPEFIKSFREDSRSRRNNSVIGIENDLEPIDSDRSDINKIIRQIEAAADNKDWTQASNLLNEAIRNNPNFAELRIRSSLLALRQHDYANAVLAATKAVELEPENPWAYGVLGFSQQASNDRLAAEASLRRALELDPANDFVLTGLSEMLRGSDDLVGAAGVYEAGYKSGKLTASSIANFSRSLARIGKTSDAKTILKKSLALENDNKFYRRAMADVLDAEGRKDDAVTFLRSEAERLNTAVAWGDLASYLATSVKEYSQAKEALLRRMELGANGPKTHWRLAYLMKQLGEPKEQIANIAEDLVTKRPDDPEAKATAGRILASLCEDDRAEQYLRGALASGRSEHSRILLSRFLLKRATRRGEAEALLREAITAAGGIVRCEIRRELADLLYHGGKSNDALIIAKEAVNQNSNCYCNLVICGQVCLRSDNLEDAKKFFEKAINIRPKASDALIGMALVTADKKNADEYINKAIKHDPKNPSCYLAKAQVVSESDDERIRDVTEALSLDPDFTEARLFLAPLLAGHGRLGECLEHISFSLKKLDTQRELISSFVRACMTIVKLGFQDRLEETLESHPDKTIIEPLMVALNLLSGKQPVVATEVLEVARDIVNKYR